MNWIIENKEWLFSGAGVAILAALINYFWKKKANVKKPDLDNSINQTIGQNIKSKDGHVDIKDNKQTININKPK